MVIGALTTGHVDDAYWACIDFSTLLVIYKIDFINNPLPALPMLAVIG